MSSIFGGGGGDNSAAILQQQEEDRKAALRAQINALYGVGGKIPKNFVAEEDELARNLREFYGTERQDEYERAERQMRFGAANTGNIGSTTYADAENDLAEKNRKGGTRIDEAVQRAIQQLRGSREGSRLNAIQLVNSGSGSDAVASASQGIRDSLNAAKASNREDLFSDLFTNLAYTKAASDAASRDQQRASYFAPKSGNAYYVTPASSGRVQP